MPSIPHSISFSISGYYNYAKEPRRPQTSVDRRLASAVQRVSTFCLADHCGQRRIKLTAMLIEGFAVCSLPSFRCIPFISRDACASESAYPYRQFRGKRYFERPMVPWRDQPHQE